MRLIEGRPFYKEPWYGSYHSMMDRCYRKKAHNYPSMADVVLLFAKNGMISNCLSNG